MHQAKRRNKGSQTTISFFFPPATHSVKHKIEDTSERSHLISRDPIVLSPSIQSSLINVGMRVRKAIPEGYKAMTNDNILSSALSSGLPATNRDSEAVLLNTHVQTTTQHGNYCSFQSSSSDRRELTPFCGLLKVGNLGQQWDNEERTITEQNELGFRAVTDDTIDPDVPILCSQSSTLSSSTNYNEQTPNKRRFSEESDSHEFSLTPSLNMTFENEIPVFHVPNIKKTPRNTLQFSPNGRFDDDFEDAEFLDYDFLLSEEEPITD